MIYPNSNQFVQRVEAQPLTKPVLFEGIDKDYTHDSEYPRRYHKYLNNRDKANIYGNELADSFNGNAVGLYVLPLNSQQQEFYDHLAD